MLCTVHIHLQHTAIQCNYNESLLYSIPNTDQNANDLYLVFGDDENNTKFSTLSGICNYSCISISFFSILFCTNVLGFWLIYNMHNVYLFIYNAE